MISEPNRGRGGVSHRKLIPGREDSRCQGPQAGKEQKDGQPAKVESHGMYSDSLLVNFSVKQNYLILCNFNNHLFSI